MKNMKKILAVGALLTLGTMAMATEADNIQDFTVNLNVIAPLTVEAAGNITFDQINANNPIILGQTKSDVVTIKGGIDHQVKFDIATSPLVNDDHQLGFNAHMSAEENGEKIPGVMLDGSGNNTSYMVANIPSFEGVQIGDYVGSITLTASYN